MPLEEGHTPWFHFDPILFLPLWIGIWRWGAYLILKGIPSLLYKPIPISEELEQGHLPVSTQMMTMIIPVYMPEPGFEECLQSWVDNRPKTIVVVVDTNSYQQVRWKDTMLHVQSHSKLLTTYSQLLVPHEDIAVWQCTGQPTHSLECRRCLIEIMAAMLIVMFGLQSVHLYPLAHYYIHV